MTAFVRAAREVQGQCTFMFADEAMNMSEITDKSVSNLCSAP
jgi:hypothetical protein